MSALEVVAISFEVDVLFLCLLFIVCGIAYSHGRYGNRGKRGKK